LDNYIRIENLTKRYGGTKAAVDNVSLDIARGEFFSLLGPSGCGKTTLLRMLGGFIQPDRGRILVDGEDVTALPPNHRPTNIVFQSYAIFPHLTVADNIGYGLRKLKLPKEERAKRIGEALAMIRLDSFGGRKATELSGGERQRVALARALIMQPKVLLLDEPLGALDKHLREAMQVELRQIQQRLDITFVFVTHDQEEALSMSDRIGVMSGGRILQVAEPKELYDTPNCREVAEFVGTMNLLPGTVASIMGEKISVRSPVLGDFEARLPPEQRFRTGDPLLIAIRPEKIEIQRHSSSAHAVRGVLTAVSYLGDRHQFQIAVAAAPRPLLASTHYDRSMDGVPFRNGEQVLVQWTPDEAVLLPG
jgi:spermidine/putrescine ABC transporter ATP-binding subunit